MRTRVSLLCYLVFASGAARAGEWDWAIEEKNRCSEGPMIQMNECLDEERRKVESLLTEKYLALMKTLADPTKLKASQLAWARFRNATCAFSTSGIGREGSLYPYARNACAIDMTKKRLRDLEEYEGWLCNGCPPRKQ